MEFRELGLKDSLLEALGRMNFSTMTEVQERAIPILLQHNDLVARSKTGSGKTGAFLVPIVQEMHAAGRPQALVILPTRELAVQVSAVAQRLSHNSGLGVAVVYGGASINIQMQKLRRGVDIVIGTPGRILDLEERGSLRLNGIRFLVLDEADIMLDMGFIEDIERIISMTPKDRQTMLFSATMPAEITDIAKKYMKHDAVRLTVGNEEQPTVETITHEYYIANGRAKFSALLAYIDKVEPKKCIIFTSTQRESEYVHRFLSSNGFDAIVMHGGLTQAKRERSLLAFKEHARFLISTNLASRGLDIPDITDIINFDAPEDPKIYIHRVGRSARMGKNGRAFTIFSSEQEDLMGATGRLANVKINHIELDTGKFREVKLPFQQRSPGRRAGPGSSGHRELHKTGFHKARRHNYYGGGRRGN